MLSERWLQVSADTPPPAELARLIDSQGHQVTAVETRSGLCVILTRTVETGLRDGHPALNREMARELGMALVLWADEEPQS